MTTLYLLAHCDDEYGCLPLLLTRPPAAVLYLTDPVVGAAGTVRRAETERFLAHFGLAGVDRHLGAEASIGDGALADSLPRAWAAILAAISGLAIREIVTPAWEGGHQDHDACAALGSALAERLGLPVLQFPFYHGRGLPPPMFAAASPLVENGPTERIPLSAGRWRAYAAAARFFPSQAGVFSTLWPAMFASFARHGYRVQAPPPGRTAERPHAGPLLYERRGKADYAEIAGRIAAFRATARELWRK